MIAPMYDFLENYCALPFRHIAMQPNDSIQPCCAWHLPNESVHISLVEDDPFNSEWLKDLRRRMLENQVIPGCFYCKNYEKLFGHSMRTESNQR